MSPFVQYVAFLLLFATFMIYSFDYYETTIWNYDFTTHCYYYRDHKPMAQYVSQTYVFFGSEFTFAANFCPTIMLDKMLN